MDSVSSSQVTRYQSSDSKRILAKFLNIHSRTSDGKKKMKSRDQSKLPIIPALDDENEEQRKRVATEAFLAAIFASLSTIKAAYANLQMAQFTYDAGEIHSADDIIVAELKNLSELKPKKLLNEASPEDSILSYRIQELKGVIVTYEVISKKLDSQLKIKESKLAILIQELAEVQNCKSLLKKRISSISLSSLQPCHFIIHCKQAIKSIRSFVSILIRGMQAADWDMDAAVDAIEPGVAFFKPSDKCYAFESFVCREMFDGFNYPDFLLEGEAVFPEQEDKRSQSFDGFLELKSMKPSDYLALNHKSNFATFCQKKYSKLVHPKMESSLFGDTEQRDLVNAGDFPETPFFSAFSEMAKQIWLLHCLALSFHPQATIFQVLKGSCFSQVWMESLNCEAFFSGNSNPQVVFSVFPGFRVGDTVIQCHAYLE